MDNIEILRDNAQEILDIQSLTDQNIEMLDKLIEQIGKELDICTGISIVGVLSTIHKVGKSFFDYKMCIRLLNFYSGCKNINYEKRDKFYKKNIFGKKRKIGYLFLQLLDRLDKDEKALLIGKLYVYCVFNEYDINSYFRICRIVEKCYYEDLHYLKEWESNQTICAQNKLIPQEIMESLYSDGLISECGINGGGFKPDDDAGVIYILSKYGEILLSIIK